MFVELGDCISLMKIALESASVNVFNGEHIPADSTAARLFEVTCRHFRNRPGRLRFESELRRTQFRTYFSLKFIIGWRSYPIGSTLIHRTEDRTYTTIALPTTYGHLIPRRVTSCS